MSTPEATRTPTRFYGRKRQTAAGRLLAATTPPSSSGTGAGANVDWTPSAPAPRSSALQTPGTPAAKNHRTPNYTPQGQLRNQGSGASSASLHYKPGERLQDRTDIFSGYGSESSAESEQEPDFTLPLGGSSHFNSRTEHFAGSTENEWQHLFQNQQAMLLKLIQQQDDMKEQYSGIGKRLDTLEDTVAGLATQCKQSGSNSENQSNNKLPRELKKKVSSIYTNLKEQFKPDESSTSSFNKAVKKSILDQVIGSSDGNKYSKHTIIAAIQRRYESVRRLWLTREKTGSEDIQVLSSHRKKIRSRRQRKFENRRCVVRANELQYWEPLTLDYMTEESDGEDPQDIVEHKLQWRSSDLNKFLVTLDARYERKVAKAGGTVAKKRRVVGQPSDSPIPTEAPQWMINQDFLPTVPQGENQDQDEN